MPKLTHRNWLDLLTTMNYSISGGLCNGYIDSWARAVRQAPIQEDHFYERLRVMETYKQGSVFNIQQLIADIEEAKKASTPDIKQMMLLEVQVLCDTIVLSQVPFHFHDFYNGNFVSQEDRNKILSLTTPLGLAMAGAQYYSHAVILCRRELDAFIEEIKKLVNIDPQTPIILGSERHTIGLSYNKINDSWKFMDIGDSGEPYLFRWFRSSRQTHFSIHSSESLRKKILASFRDFRYTTFHITILTTATHHDTIKHIFDEMISAFQQTQDIHTRVNNRGIDLLYMAAMIGDYDLCRVLIEKGALQNRANRFTYSPLDIACCNNYVNVARLLLENDVSVDYAIHGGSTSLHFACEYQLEEVATLLLQYQASVDQVNNEGCTPLWVAASRGNKAIVQILLTHHASVHLTDLKGATPLWIACQCGQLSVVELLLQNGARINQANNNGISPFCIACAKNDIGFIQFLLQHGASVNQTNAEGLNPLVMACTFENSRIVVYLLNNNANLTQQLSIHGGIQGTILDMVFNDMTLKNRQSYIDGILSAANRQQIPLASIASAQTLRQLKDRIDQLYPSLPSPMTFYQQISLDDRTEENESHNRNAFEIGEKLLQNNRRKFKLFNCF